jgi:hypothetical protein
LKTSRLPRLVHAPDVKGFEDRIGRKIQLCDQRLEAGRRDHVVNVLADARRVVPGHHRVASS